MNINLILSGSKWISKIAFVTFATLIGFKANAGVEPKLRAYLTDASLRVDSFLVVEDEVYENDDLGEYHLYKCKNAVSLEINEDNISDCFLDQFVCNVKVEIKWYDENEAEHIDTQILSVDYTKSQGVSYKSVHSHFFEGGYRVEVKILEICNEDLAPFLILSGEIEIERYQDLSLSVPTFSSISLQTNKELLISWNGMLGAEEYDLEWTFVDNYDGEGDSLTASQLKWDFTDNATRVTIKGTSYRLSLIQEEGYILFRVRATGLAGSQFKHRVEGPWSSQNFASSVSNFPNRYFIGNQIHEPTLNWQYMASFAEEGKKKEVVSYFDGTLRNRQSVTRITSDNTVIVGETIYDYQGRPAVNVLPVPAFSNIIKYYPNFTLDSATGDNYNRSHFDVGSCTVFQNPMSNDSGAARYYSSNNPYLYYTMGVLDNHNKYIPNAENYPFVRTLFTDDMTGRVVSQSGVGRTHKLYSNHETKYFYATPFQEELDRLFGNSVGYYDHYQKNMVIDPNGQVSISYMDLSGRVIATALAGEEPDGMEALPGQPAATRVLVELLSNSDTIYGADRIQTIKTFAVSSESNYVVYYEVGIDAYTDSCLNSICYNCVYNFEISLRDNCGNEYIDGDHETEGIQYFSRTIGKTPEGDWDTTCHEGISYYKVNEDVLAGEDSIRVFLPVGTYTLVKTLKVNGEAAKVFADRYISDNTCLKDQNWFDSLFVSLTDVTGCDMDCEECIEWLGPRDSFVLNFLTKYQNDSIPLTFGDTLLAHEQYNALKEMCDARCADSINPCESMYYILFADVSEGGQYYESAAGDITKHPEYCRYKFCIDNLSSYRYDLMMSETRTLKEAYEKGYLNPTDNPSFSYPAGDGDPLYENTYGSVIKATVDAKQEVYVTLGEGPTNFNVWQSLIASFWCPDLDDSDISEMEDCAVENPVDTSNCDDKNDLLWNTYRGIYQSIKREKAYQFMDTSRLYCLNKTIPEGKKVRFQSNEQIEDMIPVEDIEDKLAAVNDSIKKNCKTTCEAYADTWMENLSKCAFSGTPQKNQVRGALIRVCRAGCDEKYPQGASTVADYAMDTALFTSFYDVLDHFEIFNPGVCDDNLIDYPMPYGHSMFAYLDPNNNNCNCGGTYCDDCIENEGNSSIKSALIAQKTFEKDSFCNTCINCDDMYVAYLSLKGRYTTININDTSIAWRRIIENHFNKELQFNLTYFEYLDFIAECSNFPDSLSGDSLIFEFFENEFGQYYQLDPGLQAISLPVNLKNLESHLFPVSFASLDAPMPKRSAARMLLPPPPPLVYLDTCACKKIMDEKADLVEQELFSMGALEDALACEIENLAEVLEVCEKAYYSDKKNATDPYVEGSHWNLQQNYTLEDEVVALDIKIPDCFDCNPNDPGIWITIPGANGDEIKEIPCDSIQKYWSIFINDIYAGQLLTTEATEEFADFFDSIFSGAPYYRMDSYWNDEQRYERIISDLNKCCPRYIYKWDGTKWVMFLNDQNCGSSNSWDIDYPDSTIHYYKPWIGGGSGTGGGSVKYPIGCDTCIKMSNNLRLLGQFLRALVVRDPGVPGNYLFTNGWNLNEEGFTELYNTSLYSGSNASKLTYSFSPYPQRSFGPGVGFRIEDSSGFLLNIKLQYNYNKKYTFSRIVNVLGISPVVISCNDTSVYRFNLRVVQEITSGVYDTIFITGSTDKYNLIKRDCSPEKWLCNRPLFDKKPYKDDCKDNLIRIAKAQAKIAYERYRDSVLNRVKQAYIAKCIRSAKTSEVFNMTLMQKEYHYTLYYYDQAGNLIQTVPPQGVHPITSSTTLASVKTARASNGTPVLPSHNLNTRYEYNTLNQLVKQNTPDAGETKFWYDRLGRLVVSKNAQQALHTPNPGYSYTKYDALGRITEVGELHSATNMTFALAFDTTNLRVWIDGGNKMQITRTYYDNVAFSINYAGFQQEYLRNRVVSMTYQDLDGASYDQATHYTYDVHGNVYSLIREISNLDSLKQRFKKVDYEYDLVSGNVHYVYYQKDSIDQFIHRYTYDADNRLTNAYTSTNSWHWDNDAMYKYYLHGPLARAELGELKVQGLDYAYTIHGWIKGVNSNTLAPHRDIGKDGHMVGGNANAYVARDVYGYSLSFYEGDYKDIGETSATNHFLLKQSGSTFRNASAPLYNGNISNMVTSIGVFMEGGAFGKAYKYDQLNRLVESITYTNADSANNEWSSGGSANGAYHTRYSFDANGNILTLDRRGKSSIPEMDSLEYHYYSGTNKLKYVKDYISSGNYTTDIDDQTDTNNYVYDALGNLTKDLSEEIDSIEWTVYGKIKRITRSSGSTKPDLVFEYSPDGHRTSKTVHHANGKTSKTWYMRDAQGNVMAVYTLKAIDRLDTAAIPCDAISNFLYSSQGNEAFATFATEEVELHTWTDAVSTLRTKIETATLEETFLKLFDPTDLLNSNPTLLSATLDNYPASSFVDLIVGDKTVHTFSQDLCALGGTGYIEYLYASDPNRYMNEMENADPSWMQALHDYFYNPTPYPGFSTAKTDIQMQTAASVASAILSLGGCTWNNAVSGAIDPGTLTTLLYSYTNIKQDAIAAYGTSYIVELLETNNHNGLWDAMLGASGYNASWFMDYYDDFGELFTKNALVLDPTWFCDMAEEESYSPHQYLSAAQSHFSHGVYLGLINSLEDYRIQGNSYNLAEWHQYGSSRLGIYKADFTMVELDTNKIITYLATATPYSQVQYRGKKRYELSNHLGNVLVTISDKRIPVCDEEYAVAYFKAEVMYAQDYYPFGMVMPEREYQSDTGYRYGFNGQEKDNEVAGDNSSYTAEYWQYDPRLGRRWNVDPRPNPSISNYTCFANNPIWNNDFFGDTIKIVGSKRFIEKTTKAIGIISQTTEGKRILEKLQQSTNVYTIKKGKKTKDSFVSNTTGNFISFTGQYKNEDALSLLVHELGHAEDHHDNKLFFFSQQEWYPPDIKDGVFSTNIDGKTYSIQNVEPTSKAEASAMDKENKFRAEMGYNLRYFYGSKNFSLTSISPSNSISLEVNLRLDYLRVVSKDGQGTHPDFKTDYTKISKIQVNYDEAYILKEGKKYVD